MFYLFLRVGIDTSGAVVTPGRHLRCCSNTWDRHLRCCCMVLS